MPTAVAWEKREGKNKGTSSQSVALYSRGLLILFSGEEREVVVVVPSCAVRWIMDDMVQQRRLSLTLSFVCSIYMKMMWESLAAAIHLKELCLE